MNELDRIQYALARNRLDKDEFERCATDLLSEKYPGISPVPGGTDWGRDADIHEAAGKLPLRLLVTTSRTLEGVRKNLNSGLNSMKKHGVPVERIVLANPMLLSGLDRESLQKSARRKNVVIEAFYDQQFFASRLRRDSKWRESLLHLPGDALTLSKLPADIAESPWASLPLVGRDAELAQLQARTGDVIVVGNPGVGKTRVVAELEDLVFVDSDASPGRLLDDLRLTAPKLVALDDAGQHLELLRRLVQLRRVEGDLLDYQIIAICWPDEVDQLQDVLGTASQIKIELLERSAVDAIIKSMGVTSNLARSEILDQAEGRPGWAITLADMLTKTQNWSSLFDGKVLLGQVERFLRRSHVAKSAVDVLTLVSAVREVRESDIGKVASQLHLSMPDTRHLLLGAAHSGLVNTSNRYSANGMPERVYQVRPPMLANALVAEHAFRAEVAAVRVADLLAVWPDRADALAESAIYSALLGAEEAVPVAVALIQTMRQPGAQSDGFWRRLARLYACINQSCGEEVLSWVEQDCLTARAQANFEPRNLEPLSNLAAMLARRYLLGGGIRLLLEAATVDSRPPNQVPNHPLRMLAGLVEDLDPDLMPAAQLRHLAAAELEEWIQSRTNDARAWATYAAAVPSMMSIHRRGNFLDPGDPRQMHMVEAVISPDGIAEVYDKVWPTIRTRLNSAPAPAIQAAVDLAADWLRVGGGYDRPFGREHDARSIETAARFGKKLLAELKPLVEDNIGLTVRLIHAAELHGISLRLKVDEAYAPFFADVERGSDWQANLEQLLKKIRSQSQPWAAESPAAVVARLIEIRSMLGIAHITWPPRVEWACKAIAEVADDPAAWIEAALDSGLFPDAAPFVSTALERGQAVPAPLLERCLTDQSARWSTMNTLLSGDLTHEPGQLAVQHLKPSDEPTLEALAFQNRLTPDGWRKLLTLPDSDVRGAAAFAMFRAANDKDTWPPEHLSEEWFQAIKLLDPGMAERHQSNYLRPLFKFLASARPALLQEYVGARLDAAVAASTYGSLKALDECLHILPAEAKTAIMQRFGDTKLRWFLLDNLAGNDVGWIADAIDNKLMTPKEALETRDGYGPPEPTIPELAQLLIPRGVDPRAIATLAQYGVDFGEESQRLAKLITEFSSYTESDDPSVATVGRAGVEMFSKARERALAQERAARIRGEL